jgi:choline dehydrogenase
MRKYFEKIEHNNYLEPDTPGHGFNGFLQTNIADRTAWAGATLILKVFQAGTKLIGGDPEKVLDYLTGDAVRNFYVRTACDRYTNFVHQR